LWIALIIVVVLILAGIVFFLLWKKEPEVPPMEDYTPIPPEGADEAEELDVGVHTQELPPDGVSVNKADTDTSIELDQNPDPSFGFNGQ